MSTKLHGCLNLTRIPKNCITTNSKGDKVLWVDVLEKLNGADQYGSTHTITCYNKDGEQGKRTVYLADLKPQEFGSSAAAPKAEPEAETDPADDLPF